MIDVHLTYNLRANIDDQDYFDWMKKGIVPALKSRGVFEVRAYRNVDKADLVLVVSTWEKLEHWKEYSMSDNWKTLLETLQNNFADHVSLEIWGASQLIPQPIHPRK